MSVFQLFNLGPVREDFLPLGLNRAAIRLETGEEILKGRIVLLDVCLCLLNDVIRESEFFGNRKRVTLARNTD